MHLLSFIPALAFIVGMRKTNLPILETYRWAIENGEGGRGGVILNHDNKRLTGKSSEKKGNFFRF